MSTFSKMFAPISFPVKFSKMNRLYQIYLINPQFGSPKSNSAVFFINAGQLRELISFEIRVFIVLHLEQKEKNFQCYKAFQMLISLPLPIMLPRMR